MAATFEAKIFAQLRTRKTRDPGFATRPNHRAGRLASHIRIGKNLPGIGHSPAMNNIFANRPANPYSAKNRTKPVNFYCAAPLAQSVYIVGDFNGWDSTAHPMRRGVDGSWSIQVHLHHGHHRYLFLVDDKPVLDPQATGIARDEFNEKVSLLAVS
jgi:Glycogen recognition site of AMP-activated protein kinase